jgi:pimeloyl-ACP methyl ester carboxylesterase
MPDATLTWSDESFAGVAPGIDLCWQELGDADDPAVLLIMGVGSQMVSWPDGFCEILAARGLRLIRFDNRDCGRSTWLDQAGVPSVTEAAAKQLDNPPYLLSDMAADAAGLLTALGIGAAHVVGASLGGFVAQTLAIESPDRVRSLASVMSFTGSGRVGQPTEAAIEVLMTRPPGDLEGFVEYTVNARRVIGSPGFERDEDWVREIARRTFQRGLNPEGTQRQLVASICSGDRTERLRRLDVPTVVLHGSDDPLIAVSGGIATAEAIPGAELVIIEGWGHDWPPALWGRLADAIEANIERATEAEELR